MTERTAPEQEAFDLGYEHAREHRSDFHRRTMPSGLRLHYMQGRSAYHADRILKRVRPPA